MEQPSQYSRQKNSLRKTLVNLNELYPSKEARDAGLASGAYDGMPETFEQLEELVVTLSASLERMDNETSSLT